MKKNIILFDKKENCCACGACYNICPRNAIKMIVDEYGFKYPKINYDKCIGCGACKKVCAFQNVIEKNEPLQVVAAARKDENKIMKSASGGIFAVFAEYFLSIGGIVYGSALVNENDILVPKHIGIDNLKDLQKLLGSKYVQSDIGNVYKEIRTLLNNKKHILFSGTPCQVAGLKAFLGKEYNNLFTIDIICHGVPNAEFFKGYLKNLEEKFNGKILDFKFRDKTSGWGLNSKVDLLVNNKRTIEYLLSDESTYYHMFLDSHNYRENCYVCKYTNRNRTGDITIGDYWGIEKEHPELLKINGGLLDTKKGVSAIIINTEKGKLGLEKLGREIVYFDTTYEKVAVVNTQLREPSKYGKYRNKIMELYKIGGFNKVDEYYYSKVLKKIAIKKEIKKYIPKYLLEKMKGIYRLIKK